jgi:5S rRNA maturation endonuclease (ribonuclease M5)
MASFYLSVCGKVILFGSSGNLMLPPKEEVLSLIEEKKHLLTICEGKRDVIALRKLGFSNIRELDGPLYKVVESIEKGSRIQLLVDFDAHGRGLYSRLNHEFRQRGVYIDNELRELLFKTGVQHVEGLDTYLKE